ncbi:hypothetical protein ZHAS_00014778 [Anopheles sinensis]|uniref:Uncharacterized protein n=1 Tax=Anopheles sinensis TaxID=74873 RepID=A0A084W981_ANOSI|nr:hypothetical protein ZHAS_00014778 [Anopheles sinensis]
MPEVRFILLTLILLFVATSTGFVRLVPVVHTIRNKVNEKFANGTSYIHQKGKEQRNQSLDWEIDVRREIRDLRVTVTYYIVSSDGTTQTALISRSVDACAFLRRPTMDRFLKSFYEHMLTESILPARCPIKVGHYTVPLSGGFETGVTYSVLALNGNIQNKLFSRSFDLCQFFRRPNMDRLMKLFYDYLTATSTMPSVCPVPKFRISHTAQRLRMFMASN